MNEESENQVVNLRIDDIIPNRFQPREIFDESGLEELSESIKEHGVIQPIIVRQVGDKYELIAGERRTKASSLAGLTTIPAIIRNMDDKESAKVSLLENLQRKNLSAIEEARTYKRILEIDNMTQEDLARNLGRSQPMIANKLRLLSLPDEIQDALMKNQISERHARSLLTVKNKKDQLMFLDRIINERLTVRELDKELKKYKENPQSNDDPMPEEILSIDDEDSKKENNKGIEESNERSFMNNNIGNFGGMGLNDYNNGANNNMFYNVPNNFNNMPNMNNSMNNSNINYNNFDEEPEDNENVQNDYFANMNNNQNNSFNQNQESSLGSMFDNYNGENNNLQNDNNSNLFVSHIREDNLPKVENQFLPNFDNFNNNESNNDDDTREALNNFNQNNDFNEQNNYSLDTNNTMMNNDFNMNNNYHNNHMNDMNFNQLSDMNNLNNYNQNNYSTPNNMMNNNFGMNNGFDYNNNQFNMPNMNNTNNLNSNLPNNNYFMNDLNNNYMNNQNGMSNNMNNNMGSNFYNNMWNNNLNPMTQPMNNNPMNSSNFNNYNNSPIDFSQNINPEVNMYQPNQGGLFRQPLNIVDVPNNNYVPLENNTYEEQPSNIENDNYMLNNQPLPSEEFEENELNEQLNNVEPKEETNIPEIEVIGETTKEDEVKEENTVQDDETKEETKQNDYINLDPVYTINSTMDAVLELKKTTDRIKQNHIDIETEEIDFDDVYQITIKIKKTDTL